MFTRINGVRLFFDTENPQLAPNGAALEPRRSIVLLHGGPGVDHSVFRALGRALSEEMHVVYLDQRGSGRSEDGPVGKWTLEQWATDVRDFCDELGLEKPVVLGHSFGGYVAQKYASLFPGHAGGLVLAGTAPRFVLDRFLEMIGTLGGSGAVGVAREFYRNPRENLPAYLQACYPHYSVTPVDLEAMGRIIIRPDVADHFVRAEMQTFDLRPSLPKIQTPTLVLSGDRDVIATPRDIEDLVAALPSKLTTRVSFQNCGHEIFRDKPRESVAAIVDFNRGLPLR